MSVWLLLVIGAEIGCGLFIDRKIKQSVKEAQKTTSLKELLAEANQALTNRK